MRIKRFLSQLKRQIAVLNKFFKVMKVRYYHLLIPVLFSFLSASLGGVGLGLLVPLARGVVENDYAFIHEIPLLSQLVSLIQRPQWVFLTSNRAMFLFLSILIVFATTSKYIFSYFSRLTASYWNGKFSQRIKVFVFQRFLSFGKSYFDRKGQGYVFSVVNYSEEVLKLLNFIRDLLSNLFDIGIHLLILVWISWRLTIFAIIVAPLLHVLLRRIIKVISFLSKENTREEISLKRQILNTLSCLPLIKACSKEEKMGNIYDQSTERLRALQFRRDKFIYLINPVQGIIILCSLLILVAVVALILARDQAADLAGFAVFFYVARDMFPKFGVFNRGRQQMAQLKPPLKEVYKVFDSREKGIIYQGKKEFSGLSKEIKIENLNFSYSPKRPILKNISTAFEKGRMSAIVGPTGSGKTTLVNLIMRFYDCSSNSIKIDGVDIREFKINSLRKHISIVTQDDFLFNDTLKNNIIFACEKEPSEGELAGILKKTRLDGFVSRLPEGLFTEIGDRGIKLSGGEKQRVSIARALLRKTEVLILDEATSALDTQTERLIQKAIEEVVRGRTTIVIAHRLSTIKNADKIIVIENGKLKEEGSLEELLDKKGKFFQYWHEQKFY